MDANNSTSNRSSKTNSSPLVLIVDDDTPSALVLSRFLASSGYQTRLVADGREALLACQKELPAIILMDAIMPNIDGFECCQLLHERYQTRCPPILMLTGLNDNESVDRAFEVGATDYVTKPFHWAVLRQRVRRTIRAHQDRQQLQATLEKLHHLATTDGLTNIANRRVFDERLYHEWKRLRREQSELSLALFDIDCFKAYNDHYGHLAGDQCLYDVAQIISQVVRRPADLAARYGGEEFALILPNTHTKGAIYLAEQVQQNLQQKALRHAKSTVRQWVTLSVGIATTTPTQGSPHTLIGAADKALYTAKHQGRDRVIAQNLLR